MDPLVASDTTDLSPFYLNIRELEIFRFLSSLREWVHARLKF